MPSRTRSAALRPVFLSVAISTLIPGLAASPALAQSAASAGDDIDLPQIVISATGTATPASAVASSVTVITADDIARTQERSVPDVLQAVPGLNVVQTGGPGGTTSIFMRGTNSNQVKILVDGVDMTDPSSPDGTFNLGQLMTNDISRIEVLRGPQSGLYGSDAIGGVISITTKRGSGPAKISGFVEAGALGTFNQALGVSGGTDTIGYAFNVGHFASTSIPVTPQGIVPPGYPTNFNSFDNWTYSGRLDFDLSDNFSVNLTGRYIDSQLVYTPDIFSMTTYTSMPAMQTSTSFSRVFLGKAEGVWTALDGNLVSSFGVSATDQSRPTTGPNETENGTYDGQMQTFYLRSTWTFMPGQTLLSGIERKNESMTSSSYYSSGELSASNGDTAAYLQLQSSFGDRVFLALNGRFDSDDTYGDHTTYRIAPAYLIPETGTKLKATYGTGFNAPSLYQLYAPVYGNPDLKPEESTGWDVGFEQQVLNGQASFGATYFQNDLTNLIGYDPATYVYVNVSQATTKGVEAFVAVQVTDSLSLRVDYTYTQAQGTVTPGSTYSAGACAPATLDTCNLLRRPNNKVSVAANWQATDNLNLNATLIYVSSWWDIVRLSSDYVDQPGYTILNLAANYAVSPNATVYGRINNLFNETYEDPNGFLAPGFGAYGGVRFTF
ncbi:TonB-dependent receptor plug domain-containing protein [Aquabacter sp. P-9]|uniref:TonB-dependent receptor plug domain-containing protein n=1 Tax=Aquabacter sediminis TaxID=3029197 RepID=UPI00237D97DF|nr:TonB-dependent receptor [Aquabacter sp. P-9]MDE1567780.1 TonB-dependent receptor [Aquabacter sp. P-9]